MNLEEYKKLIYSLWHQVEEDIRHIWEEGKQHRQSLDRRDVVRMSWQPMKDNTRKSQVIDRSPRLSRIRHNL